MIEDPAALIRLVADPLRLAILGRAAEGSLVLDEIAGSFATPKKKVAEAVGKLRAAGLITDDLRLNDENLRMVAARLPSPEAAAAAVTDGPWSDDERDVLRRFFSGTRLTSIPSAKHKRLIVLERLAQEFEPGLRYQERDVNFTLQLFHADYAALRRYLVDEGLLTRADGVYWRTGGRYLARSAPAES
ncbi:MAG: DUF2087 domain-containing protein [Actinomycetota bacterium]|nr:DUF2087 domain-containing protein [Actinomycetota bacterium]